LDIIRFALAASAPSVGAAACLSVRVLRQCDAVETSSSG
jgi:hypothetical protein